LTEATKTRTANDPPGAGTRVLPGALAGFSATALMTALMWRLHRRLPAGERYPLPPREITERIVEPRLDARARDGATALTYRELAAARKTMLRSGPLRDAAGAEMSTRRPILRKDNANHSH
jgi:hypothetical protein